MLPSTGEMSEAMAHAEANKPFQVDGSFGQSPNIKRNTRNSFSSSFLFDTCMTQSQRLICRCNWVPKGMAYTTAGVPKVGKDRQ